MWHVHVTHPPHKLTHTHSVSNHLNPPLLPHEHTTPTIRPAQLAPTPHRRAPPMASSSSAAALWTAAPHPHGSCIRIHAIFHQRHQRRGRRPVVVASSVRPLQAASLAVATAPVAVASRRTAAEEAVYEVVLRQAALVEEATHRRGAGAPRWAEEDAVDWGLLLGDAYHRCGEVCAEYAKTFYLGQPTQH